MYQAKSNGIGINKPLNMLFVSHFSFKQKCSQSERSQPKEKSVCYISVSKIRSFKMPEPAKIVSFLRTRRKKVFSLSEAIFHPSRTCNLQWRALYTSDVHLRTLRIPISAYTLQYTTLDNRCCLSNVTSKPCGHPDRKFWFHIASWMWKSKLI